MKLRGRGQGSRGAGGTIKKTIRLKKMSRKGIKSHHDLDAYQLAFDAAMQIFELSKKFPVEERFALTD